MINTAIKGVLAHKLRLALTALAIVMGVAFVAGTYVFTDTINARFSTLFSDVYAGIDATVRPPKADFGQEQASLDPALLDTIRGTDGVAVAAPAVGGVAQIIAPDGSTIGGQGPPTIGLSWTDEPALNAFRIDDNNGRAPAAAGEVAIDVATAENNGLSVGDEVQIQLYSGAETFTIVGLANFGTEDNLAGATISLFQLGEAQHLLGLEGRYTQIDVLAEDPIEPEELVTRLQAALPSGVEAVTGSQQGQEELDSMQEGLGFVNKALLAFAGVAIFVGAFIISNTFRIIVAQRTRELALLRALGASARQVTLMVLTEALIVGVLASALGVVAGIGFSMLLKIGMGFAGLGMPDGPLTVAPRTVAIAMAVGVTITLVSALQPARRAAKTPPVAALRDIAPGQAPLRRRLAVGAAISLTGAALMAGGFVAENGASLPLVASGALAVFLGVSVLAPLFARPIVGLLGRPLPGVVGDLARGNTMRQPRRTAATASALMIGVALVAFVSIFGASIKASITDTIEGAFPADLLLSSSNYSVGVTPVAIDRLNELDELAAVSPIKGGEARMAGEVVWLAAVDPSTIEAVYSTKTSTPLATLGSGLLVHTNTLQKHAWTVGQQVTVEYASGDVEPITITGTIEDNTVGDYLISHETYAEHFASDDAMVVLARLADGVALSDGKAAATSALTDFPGITVNTQSEQIAATESLIDQLMVLFSGLLGLAVIIAVIGIANTLALTTLERTREIGLLRAVGMSRRQVRRMVRWEAVMTSLFGALLGIGLGAALGYAVILALADEGLGTFAFPSLQIAACLAIAAVAGTVAAIGPARKASRMNVLEAISFE